jgi:hypothetical protein
MDWDFRGLLPGAYPVSYWRRVGVEIGQLPKVVKTEDRIYSFDWSRVLTTIVSAQMFSSSALFHAGTKLVDGQLTTADGRFLSIATVRDSL